MTLGPPNRTGHFSDSRALTRAVQRPANAFEAFGRCWEDLFDSLVNAVIGILLDPTQVQTPDACLSIPGVPFSYLTFGSDSLSSCSLSPSLPHFKACCCHPDEASKAPSPSLCHIVLLA